MPPMRSSTRYCSLSFRLNRCAIEILERRHARRFFYCDRVYRDGVGWDGLLIEISGWLDGWVAGYVAPSSSLLSTCSPFWGRAESVFLGC